VNAHGSVDKRHVSIESFDRYLASRVPVVLRVAATPEVFIFIEPLKLELGLRVQVTPHSQPPETGLQNIIARTTKRDDKTFLEVAVTAPSLFRDAYPLLCAMADRIQIAGMSPNDALLATLDTMAALMRPPEAMSRESEIGLFGELLLVGGLIGALGEAEAIQAWRGGLAEEHDFGLPDTDVEVKTTTSERRAHWIESLTQLLPTQGRPLWLVSHQITAAGSGRGASLPDLVDSIRGLVESTTVRARLETALIDSGWREEGRDRLTTRWTRRAASLAFPVNNHFPRLVPDVLRGSGVQLDRIIDVKYRIDLGDLTAPRELPAIIAEIISHEGWT
jgi:hypothetical protein